MNRSRSSQSRSRYSTPLPFRFRSQDSRSRVRSPVDGYQDLPQPITVPDYRSPDEKQEVELRISGETTDSSKRGRCYDPDSEALRMALENDSWLPYSRVKHRLGTERTDAQPNSSSPDLDSNEPSPNSSLTHSSNSNGSDTSETSPDQNNDSSSKELKRNLSFTPPNIHTEIIPSEPARCSDQQLQAQYGQPQGWLGPEPYSQELQVAQLQAPDEPVSMYSPNQAIEEPKSPVEPVQNFSRPISRQARYTPPIPTRSKLRNREVRSSSLSAHPKYRLERQHLQRSSSMSNVHYEKVEGVTMDTQPCDASERQTGLSIPEIEARDVRQIPDHDSSSEDDDNVYQSISRRPHYACPPPPICAPLTSVRSVSPRPPTEGHDHVFIDRYSRAAEDKPPPSQAHLVRHRPSKITEISSESESDTRPESAPRNDDSYEGGAEPPTVRRSKAFEELDDRMTSRTSKAKKLMRNILKGISLPSLPGHHRRTSESSENSEADSARPSFSNDSRNARLFIYDDGSQEAEDDADITHSRLLNPPDRPSDGSRLLSTPGIGDHPLYMDDRTSLDTPRTTIYVGNGD